MQMMDPMPEENRPQPSPLRPIPSWRFKFVLACPIRSVPRSTAHLSPFASPSPARPQLRFSSTPSSKPMNVLRSALAGAGAGAGGGSKVTCGEGDDEGVGGGFDSPSTGRRRRALLEEDSHLAMMDAASAAAAAAAAAAAGSSSDTVSSTSTTSTVTGGGDSEDEEYDDVDVDWPITNGEQHVLQWETDLLANLGADMLGFSATNTIGSTVVSTAMSAVLATAMLPVTVFESVSSLDNPWSIASERVEAAGAQLAEVLLARVHGERPVTLIGYSMVRRGYVLLGMGLTKPKTAFLDFDAL